MRLVLPLIGLASLLGLLAACFGSTLFLGGQFAYRDAAHFYYPLYQVIQAEWEAGRVPGVPGRRDPLPSGRPQDLRPALVRV